MKTLGFIIVFAAYTWGGQGCPLNASWDAQGDCACDKGFHQVPSDNRSLTEAYKSEPFECEQDKPAAYSYTRNETNNYTENNYTDNTLLKVIIGAVSTPDQEASSVTLYGGVAVSSVSGTYSSENVGALYIGALIHGQDISGGINITRFITEGLVQSYTVGVGACGEHFCGLADLGAVSRYEYSNLDPYVGGSGYYDIDGKLGGTLISGSLGVSFDSGSDIGTQALPLFSLGVAYAW
jgi:hypothetical protein